MPLFSQLSTGKLNTVHRDLQTVLNEAIKHVDFSVVYGHRTPDQQGVLYKKGRKDGKVVKLAEVVTYLDGTIKKSKHNFIPAQAVDVIPYPTQWSDPKEFYHVAGVIMTIATQMLADGRITNKIEWGGRWKTLIDLPHFQI